MKNMNEQELDNLIRESIGRQELLNSINRSVMKEIRHTTRKRRIRQWARVVAFAFGIPTITIITAALAEGQIEVTSPISAIYMVLGGAIFAASTISIICNFSIKDM